ncbi:rab protein [Biscogniauxia mediterranea]|nr:rab protein [Biscogniauxia mediterranea]
MASSEDSFPVLKVLIIGPSGAGKSAHCDDQFDPESSTATIGIDFKRSRRADFHRLGLKMKKLAVRGKAYRLNIFDTLLAPVIMMKAGQERFRTLSTSYYRGAHAVILVYDITNRKSFLSMERWIDEARSNASPDAVLYLVGSKLDKVAAGGRAVSYEEGKAFADSQGAGFCEISSKTRENVRRPFIEVVDRIVQKPELLSSTTSGPKSGNGALNLGMASSYSSACPC